MREKLGLQVPSVCSGNLEGGRPPTDGRHLKVQGEIRREDSLDAVGRPGADRDIKDRNAENWGGSTSRGCMRRTAAKVAPGEEERSATDCVSVTLLRSEGGASDTGESPWRQLRERAEKIPGDKKHDPGLMESSHKVIALRSSIQHRDARSNVRQKLSRSLPPSITTLL